MSIPNHWQQILKPALSPFAGSEVSAALQAFADANIEILSSRSPLRRSLEHERVYARNYRVPDGRIQLLWSGRFGVDADLRPRIAYSINFHEFYHLLLFIMTCLVGIKF